jgi:hypothetical protein
MALVIVILLSYLWLGIGFNNTLKAGKKGGFTPSIILWPIFLAMIAIMGPEVFDSK